jgi:hypothetical protein
MQMSDNSITLFAGRALTWTVLPVNPAWKYSWFTRMDYQFYTYSAPVAAARGTVVALRVRI